MFKITITATLEGDEGVWCEQKTVWTNMDQADMTALEGSYLNWLASLPTTIGGAKPSTDAG